LQFGIFSPILVNCAKKNLATLVHSSTADGSKVHTTQARNYLIFELEYTMTSQLAGTGFGYKTILQRRMCAADRVTRGVCEKNSLKCSPNNFFVKSSALNKVAQKCGLLLQFSST
jgi:hypothetical protein